MYDDTTHKHYIQMHQGTVEQVIFVGVNFVKSPRWQMIFVFPIFVATSEYACMHNGGLHG